MEIEEGEIKYGEVTIMVFLLLFAVAARFVAISHQLTLDWSVYEKVLEAFFRTQSRSQIFLVQFSGIICFAALLPIFAKKEITVFKYAFPLFVVVSVLRYFIPTFAVSVVGDLLVSIIVLAIARSFNVPKIALVLYVVAIIVLIPRGLWILAFGMMSS